MLLVSNINASANVPKIAVVTTIRTNVIIPLGKSVEGFFILLT